MSPLTRRQLFVAAGLAGVGVLGAAGIGSAVASMPICPAARHRTSAGPGPARRPTRTSRRRQPRCWLSGTTERSCCPPSPPDHGQRRSLERCEPTIARTARRLIAAARDQRHRHRDTNHDRRPGHRPRPGRHGCGAQRAVQAARDAGAIAPPACAVRWPSCSSASPPRGRPRRVADVTDARDPAAPGGLDAHGSNPPSRSPSSATARSVRTCDSGMSRWPAPTSRPIS